MSIKSLISQTTNGSTMAIDRATDFAIIRQAHNMVRWLKGVMTKV